MTVNGPDPLEQVDLPDGGKAYKLTDRQAQALAEMIADRVWWDNTMTRVKRAWPWLGGFLAVLAFLAAYWPSITRVAQAIFRELPQ